MFKRLLVFALPFFIVFAVWVNLNYGVNAVNIDSMAMRSFLQAFANIEAVRLELPEIDYLTQHVILYAPSGNQLQILTNLLNVLIDVGNFIIMLGNVTIKGLNILIGVFKFIVAVYWAVANWATYAIRQNILLSTGRDSLISWDEFHTLYPNLFPNLGT